jgi:hypothetical protein
MFYAESHFPTLRAGGERRLFRKPTIAFLNDRTCRSRSFPDVLVEEDIMNTAAYVIDLACVILSYP